MPRGDPFSQLCQLAASLAQPIAADLHTHTTASDGDYTPSQILAFAQQAKLKAVAITDHDTLAGYDEARTLASPVKLIPGVELSVLWGDDEMHLLAYAFDPDDDDLRSLLREHCELRRERFHAMVKQLRSKGIVLEIGDVMTRSPSVGRGNLAKLLTRAGHSPRTLIQELMLPRTRFEGMGNAINIVHRAGGIVSLAHPRSDTPRSDFEELLSLGMDALESCHPSIGLTRRTELVAWARELGMFTTGGSDCHGLGSSAIGSHGISMRELTMISTP